MDEADFTYQHSINGTSKGIAVDGACEVCIPVPARASLGALQLCPRPDVRVSRVLFQGETVPFPGFVRKEVRGPTCATLTLEYDGAYLGAFESERMADVICYPWEDGRAVTDDTLPVSAIPGLEGAATTSGFWSVDDGFNEKLEVTRVYVEHRGLPTPTVVAYFRTDSPQHINTHGA